MAKGQAKIVVMFFEPEPRIGDVKEPRATQPAVDEEAGRLRSRPAHLELKEVIGKARK
jgi:hypothetical protein